MARGIFALAIALAIASPFAAAQGCDGSGLTELTTSPAEDGGGGGIYADAPADADASDSADAPDVPVPKPAPVLIGITANGASTAPADAKEAELTTFAAGVRAVVVARAPADLDADAFTALAKDAAFYAVEQKVVLFDLTLVDRAADGRPPALAGIAWDAPATMTLVEGLVDQIFAAYGSELQLLAFGRDADVYLAKHAGERAAFESLVNHTLTYAHNHAKAPAGLRIGAGFSYIAAMNLDTSWKKLLAASDLAVLSYLPGREDGSAAPASAITADADALIASAGGKPIVLESVGYPSSAAASASDDKQDLFYKTLFAALEPRRASFALVNAHELFDLSPDLCSAYCAAQAEPANGPFSAYACSVGLFAASADAGAKSAWIEVLSGAATFASP